MGAGSRDKKSTREFGSYRVEGTFARRNGGRILRAHDVDEDRPVFLAVLEASVKEEPDFASRFQRRMETVAQLHHPHIAAISDIGLTPEGLPYAAMEFRQCVTLADLLSELPERDEELSVVKALDLVGGIADALKLAHPAGLIHLDLQPENILIDEDDEPFLIDLGLPIGKAEVSPAVESQEAGIVNYASPEQAEGKALSGQSNIYSLGIILYELLAGHRPMAPISSWDIFENSRTQLPMGVPLEEVRDDLTSHTYELVKNCLWRNEWSRFETVDTLISTIETAKVREREFKQRAELPPYS
jgi:serine/threonine-protein kinase